MEKKMVIGKFATSFVVGIALISSGVLWPEAVLAQSYPTKNIRLIIPFVPGGGTDVMGRLIASGMSKDLGVTIVVVNVGGAGGAIGATEVMRSAPDGYTLMAGTPGPITIGPNLRVKNAYDPLKDFTPISQITQSPAFLLVSKDSPITSVKDLIDRAKKDPGRINYATPGVGSMNHLATELFASRAGIKMTHIPYKGSGAVYTDLMSNRVDIFINNIQPTDGNIKAGNIRLLGIATSSPSMSYPGVPTIASDVPGYEASSWMGLFAPAGTSQSIVDRLYRAVTAALKDPKTRELLTSAGGEPLGSTPAEFTKFVTEKYKDMGDAIRTANIPLIE